MKDVIHAALKPVKARQQWQFVLRCTALGLLAGAAATGVAFAVNLGVKYPWQVAAGLLVAGPVIGFVVGVLLRKTWHAAAEAVDGHYGLKDRTVTALAFADEAHKSDLHALQMTEAVSHLGGVEPKAVAPIKAPREWPAVVAAAAVAVALLVFWPAKQQVAQAAPAPVPEHIKAEADKLKAMIAALEKKIDETVQDQEDDKEGDAGLKDLLKKLGAKVEEIDQPGVDEKEALAKLSQMDAAMQAMATQLNVAALEGALSSLGTALAASTPFEGAGKALQDGKLEKAAKELEKLDEVKLTPKEAKALEEKLKQLAKQMGDAGQGSLSEAVGELADALKGGNGKVGTAAKNIAKKVNNAVKRKKVNDLLTQANEELKESKCQCQNNGGAKIKQPSKSNDPSSNWGRAVSLNTDGEKTKLGSTRKEMQIQGTPGSEGDSDVETTATPEARQKAAREYREKHEAAMKRNSEAVIEGEAIPLGHRQMVKKYFELIRPSNGELTGDKPATPEKK